MTPDERNRYTYPLPHIDPVAEPERYRVLEAVTAWSPGERARMLRGTEGWQGEHTLARFGAQYRDLVDRLVAAGWRPESGKDEAARLLRQVQS